MTSNIFFGNDFFISEYINQTPFYSKNTEKINGGQVSTDFSIIVYFSGAFTDDKNFIMNLKMIPLKSKNRWANNNKHFNSRW